MPPNSSRNATPHLASAYATAFDAWLAAGHHRNDLLVTDLLDALGIEIRATVRDDPTLCPDGTLGDRLIYDHDIDELLGILR